MQNYTGHGWEGKEYAKNGYLSAAELSKNIRLKLKDQFPTCKFSVTKESYAGGRSISIALMEAPFEVFAKPDINVVANNPHYGDLNGRLEWWESDVKKGYHQLNQYHLKDDFYLTPEGMKVCQKMLDIAQDYNYDDSDGMIDYFSTNFYLHPSIGKWDKPFKKLERN